MFQRRIPEGLLVVGVAMVVGLLLNFQLHIVGQRIPDELFDRVATGHFVRAMIWAMLTPVIFAVYGRFPLFGPGLGGKVFLHLTFSVATMWLVLAMRQAHVFFFEDPDWAHFGANLVRRWTVFHLIDVATYWAVLVIAHAFALWKRSQDLARREMELREQLAEAELDALRDQLQPHFLFNALSAIANMVREGRAKRAVASIVELSTLLRAVMDSSRIQVVDLRAELDFNRRYLSIESARFGEKLVVQFDIDPETERMEVPTMLLHPMVENGIKHGIAKRRSPGELLIASRLENGKLVLSVENDGPDGNESRGEAGGGVGLSTTRSRLERLYGCQAELVLQQRVDRTVVTVRLPARRAV
jgi:two-component system LytT family sensor kinase